MRMAINTKLFLGILAGCELRQVFYENKHF